MMALDVLDLTQPAQPLDLQGRAIRQLAKLNHGLVVMQVLFETLSQQQVRTWESGTSIIVRYNPNVWN